MNHPKPPTKSRTPWEFFDAFPPPYCRCLAKRPGGGTADMAVTDAELAIASGIPLVRVREISRMENWNGVAMDEMRRFFVACNFDPTNATHRDRVAKYQNICRKRKSVPFHYLRRSPKWETEFLPLLLQAKRIMTSRNKSLPETNESASLASG